MPIYAADYGATPSANAATNKTAIDTAVTNAKNSNEKAVVLPGGKLNCAPLGVINSNAITLQGQGMLGGTELCFNNQTGNSITFSQFGHMGIKDVYITSSVRKTDGSAIRITGGAFAPRIERVRIDYHWDGVKIDHSAEAIIKELRMRYMLGTVGVDIKGIGSTQAVYGVFSENINADNPYPVDGNGPRKTWAASTAFSAGDIIYSNGNVYQCSVSGTSGSVAPSTIPGTGATDAFSATITDGTVQWKFVCNTLIWFRQDSYAFSVAIDNAALIGGYTGVITRDSMQETNSRPCWFNSFNLQIDHSYGNCLSLNRGEGFFADQGWFGSSLTGSGFYVSPYYAGEIMVSKTRVLGHHKHGFHFETGACAATVTECISSLNSQAGAGLYHGLYAEGSCRDLIISRNTFGRAAIGYGMQGCGVKIDTGADRFIVDGNNLTGNHNYGYSGPSASSTRIITNNLT